MVKRELHVGDGGPGHWSFVFNAVENESTEAARCERSAAPVQATLRLQSGMRKQGFARQIKCQPLLASILRNIRRGLAPIEECDIALCELHGLIVLDHRASARNLKQGTVRIHARE